VDHDQTFIVLGSDHYHFSANQGSADFYGSGLRKTPEASDPNLSALPSCSTVNTSLTHAWAETPFGKVERQLTITNLLDRSYLLRGGSDAGVGRAPVWGPVFIPRRALEELLDTNARPATPFYLRALAGAPQVDNTALSPLLSQMKRSTFSDAEFVRKKKKT